MTVPTQADLDAAIGAGNVDRAGLVATALGTDPEVARTRAMCVLAFGIDSETLPSLEQIVAMQQQNALRAVDRILREHGGSRTCGNPWRLLNSRDYAGGSVERRDWPWIAEALVSGEALTDAAARAFVIDAWTRCEFPEANLSTDRWLEIFETVGFLTDQDPQEVRDGVEPVVPPTETMRLYRGAAPAYARGMAWTVRRGKAQWYADRFPAEQGHFVQGKVYVADVEPWRVLARFGRRGESEIVINPTDLDLDEA